MQNYSTLKQSLADYLADPVGEAFLPTAIALAEARHNRELRVRQMVKRSTSTLDPAQGYITLPTDWLEAKNIQVTVNGAPRKLEYITLEQADDYREARNNTASIPTYFNVTGGQLEIIPLPSASTPVEMTYYAQIPALSDQNTTNWLLSSWPDLYVYGALAHCAPYLNQDARAATWSAFYDRALQEITDSDARAQYSGSVLKSRARVF